MDVNLD
jgi:hypothetical protein